MHTHTPLSCQPRNPEIAHHIKEGPSEAAFEVAVFQSCSIKNASIKKRVDLRRQMRFHFMSVEDFHSTKTKNFLTKIIFFTF